MTSVCLGNLCRHLILKSADYYTCADAISLFKACNQLFWLFWWHSREKLTGYYVHIVILLTSKFSNVVFCRKSQISTFPCTNTIIIWECCPLCQCRGRDKHNGGTAPTSRWWYLCHGFIISWQYNLFPYIPPTSLSLSLHVSLSPRRIYQMQWVLQKSQTDWAFTAWETAIGTSRPPLRRAATDSTRVFNGYTSSSNTLISYVRNTHTTTDSSTTNKKLYVFCAVLLFTRIFCFCFFFLLKKHC